MIRIVIGDCFWFGLPYCVSKLLDDNYRKSSVRLDESKMIHNVSTPQC